MVLGVLVSLLAPEGISAQSNLGDFLELDWSSYPAAFPSDKHGFDVIGLAHQMNAGQATASRSSVVVDISPAQKRKRVEGNDVTDDERTRKKSKRNGIDESDAMTAITSQERVKCSVRRKCATSPPC
jgi:hypothetical protein